MLQLLKTGHLKASANSRKFSSNAVTFRVKLCAMQTGSVSISCVTWIGRFFNKTCDERCCWKYDDALPMSLVKHNGYPDFGDNMRCAQLSRLGDAYALGPTCTLIF